MELYARIERSDDAPEPEKIGRAWCNNAGRFFDALLKTYGRCLGYHTEKDRQGRMVVTGWRFEKRVRDNPDFRMGSEYSVITTTVRLFMACPPHDPAAVTLNGAKVPFKPFILRTSRHYAPRGRRAA
jgi:hypothetical protein